jgi:hypothetical protein
MISELSLPALPAPRPPYDVQHATRRIAERALGVSLPDDYWDRMWAFYQADPDIRECMVIHDWHLQAIAQMGREKAA